MDSFDYSKLAEERPEWNAPPDWYRIADAIRSERFQEISDREWGQIADMVEAKGRGKGRPSKPLQGAALMDDSAKVLYGGRTVFERHIYIIERYYELIKQGLKPSKAQFQIVDESPYNVKTVEAILAEHRTHEKMCKTLLDGDFSTEYYVKNVMNSGYDSILRNLNPDKWISFHVIRRIDQEKVRKGFTEKATK